MVSSGLYVLESNIYVYFVYLIKDMSNILNQQKYSQDEIVELMREIPNKLQRIAGKRIPIEKFVARKSRKFILQNNRLVLPGIEMLLLWNGFFHIQGKLNLALEIVEKELITLDNSLETFLDDVCLLHLFRAVIFRELKDYDNSEKAFLSCLQHEHDISLDHYIAPLTHYEYGVLFMTLDNPEKAKRQLMLAKEFHKYSMENMINYRIHAALTQIEKQNKTQTIK
jgi:tetratricopeptide (TPR) repeat protein